MFRFGQGLQAANQKNDLSAISKFAAELDTLRASSTMTPKAYSEGLGVSAHYIINELKDEALFMAKKVDPSTLYEGGKYFDVNDPTFHDIKEVMACGPRSLGSGMMCPRDGKPKCSLVDALEKQGLAGPANVFLSWVWGYKVSTFVETIRAWLEETGEDPKKTFIWICFFW